MKAQKKMCVFFQRTHRLWSCRPAGFNLSLMHWFYVLFPFLFGERDIFFGNGIEAPFMLFYFNLLSFSFLKKTFFVFVSMFITRLIIVMLSWIRKRKKKTREKKRRYAWFTTLFIGFHITEQSWLQITLNRRILS